MAHITQIIYKDGRNIFNYVAKNREDFIFLCLEKMDFPNENWAWELITTENLSSFFPDGNIPQKVQDSFSKHLTAISATRNGKTSYFSAGDPKRPSLLDIAWEWIVFDAERVTEWEGQFVITDKNDKEIGKYNTIIEAHQMAKNIPDWEMFLTYPEGTYGGAPLFSQSDFKL